jgi:hypothetical protein
LVCLEGGPETRPAHRERLPEESEAASMKRSEERRAFVLGAKVFRLHRAMFLRRSTGSGVGLPAAGVAAVLLVWLNAGCITPPAGLAMVKGTEQDDIPVPKDFDFKPDASEAFDVPTSEAGKFRHWTGTYEGPERGDSLPPWYITEMRARGWSLKGIERSNEMARLRFEKGEEEATIEITRELEALFGVYKNVICARIRQRGTEDYTVEENLVSLKAPRIEPASYKASEAAPASPAPASSTNVKKPARNLEEPREKAAPPAAEKPILEEIEESEGPEF